MQQGLLQPILVRSTGESFELVAGSRRLAACRQLGWRKIPAQIVELSDQEAFEIALTENIARKSMDPVEEALAFRDYIKKFGWGSEADLARKLGKSPSYVSRRLKLLTLPEKYLDEILRRRNNPSLAQEILSVDDNFLKQELLALSSEIGLSSKEVRRINQQSRSEKEQFNWLKSDISAEDRKARVTKRAVQRAVVALRLAMHRLDEVIETVGDDDWILKEILMQQRQALHSQIDLVCNLTKRIKLRHNLENADVVS
jgi:ParB family transcriptional regulator, chromosome partitioning protein